MASRPVSFNSGCCRLTNNRRNSPLIVLCMERTTNEFHHHADSESISVVPLSSLVFPVIRFPRNGMLSVFSVFCFPISFQPHQQGEFLLCEMTLQCFVYAISPYVPNLNTFWAIGIIRCCHDDVIKWKHLPRYWPIARRIHRSPVNFPQKGQWRGAWMFFFDLRLNKRLRKQSWGWWFEAPPRPIWRRCNELFFLSSLERVILPTISQITWSTLEAHLKHGSPSTLRVSFLQATKKTPHISCMKAWYGCLLWVWSLNQILAFSGGYGVQ